MIGIFVCRLSDFWSLFLLFLFLSLRTGVVGRALGGEEVVVVEEVAAAAGRARSG